MVGWVPEKETPPEAFFGGGGGRIFASLPITTGALQHVDLDLAHT